MKEYFISLLFSNILFAANWNGADYHEHNNTQEQWFNDFAQLEILGYEQILDIGCGDGKNTLKIAKNLTTGSILGIDKEVSMTEFACELLSKQESLLADKVSFKTIDALDFIDVPKYDLVVSFSVLHWIKEQKNLFAIIKNCLKKEGKFYCIFSTNFNEGFSQFNLTKNQILSFYKKNNLSIGAYSYTKEYYEEALKQLGFYAKINIHPKKNVFNNTEDFFNWLKQWLFNYFAGVAKNKQKKFLCKFIEIYKQQDQTFNKETGEITWHGFMMTIDAIKKE